MVYGTYNYSYWGESKPTCNVWGLHPVGHVVNLVISWFIAPSNYGYNYHKPKLP
jgi:hypothetical protein